MSFTAFQWVLVIFSWIKADLRGIEPSLRTLSSVWIVFLMKYWRGFDSFFFRSSKMVPVFFSPRVLSDAFSDRPRRWTIDHERNQPRQRRIDFQIGDWQRKTIAVPRCHWTICNTQKKKTLMAHLVLAEVRHGQIVDGVPARTKNKKSNEKRAIDEENFSKWRS